MCVSMVYEKLLDSTMYHCYNLLQGLRQAGPNQFFRDEDTFAPQTGVKEPLLV